MLYQEFACPLYYQIMSRFICITFEAAVAKLFKKGVEHYFLNGLKFRFFYCYSFHSFYSIYSVFESN